MATTLVSPVEPYSDWTARINDCARVYSAEDYGALAIHDSQHQRNVYGEVVE